MTRIIFIAAFVLVSTRVFAQPATSIEDASETLANQIAPPLLERVLSRSAVAVYPFSDATGEVTQLGVELATQLRDQLANLPSRQFELTERIELADIIKERKLSMQGLTGDTQQSPIMQFRSADYLVSGKYRQLRRGQYQVDVNVKNQKSDVLCAAHVSMVLTPHSSNNSSGGVRPLSIVALASGVVAVAGYVTWMVEYTRAKNLLEGCPNRECMDQVDADRYTAAKTIANVGLGVGAVATVVAVGSVASLIFDASGKENAERATIQFGPGSVMVTANF